MHACCVRHLRRRCGYSPGLLQEHSSLTEQATGNLRFSGFRSSEKHAFGRASGTAPRRKIKGPPPFQQPAGNAVGNARYRRASQSAPPLRSIKNALHPVFDQEKTARRLPEPQPRAPPAPSSKHLADAVTSSRNAYSKSSTFSSSFWNWSSLPQPSWKNSSS